jgi:hypothetical protein
LETLEQKPMEPDKSDKRRLVRKRTDQLLYAEFGPDNGSILLNLSEEGCSFQSLAPVRGDQVRFSVSVGDGHKLEGDGQMVWSDTGKKTGGVRFLNPSYELRKQVRAWLDQTLVTTDGKLDPAAVESEAKRRRKKLREDAKAEAERAQREGALQNRVEAPGEGSRPAPQVRPASDPITDATPNPIALDDSSTRTPHGKPGATLRGIGLIVLAGLLFTGLVTYRRELGHFVMSIGSNIAGEKGATAAPAETRALPVDTSSGVKADVKAVAMPGGPESTSEESADTGDTGKAEFVRAANAPAPPAKHVAPQQDLRGEDVSSLWTSVENGDTEAEVALATRYVRGEGVPQSCAQARVLLEAAMKRGSSEAKQKLSELGQAGCQ